jgi:hypothetical protein
MKIRSLGAELFHANGWKEGQTNMTDQAVLYRSFEKN